MAHAAGLPPARGATSPARRVPNTAGHSPGGHRVALAVRPTRANKTPPDHGLVRRRRAGHQCASRKTPPIRSGATWHTQPGYSPRAGPLAPRGVCRTPPGTALVFTDLHWP